MIDQSRTFPCCPFPGALPTIKAVIEEFIEEALAYFLCGTLLLQW
jgi:hypothetical protein